MIHLGGFYWVEIRVLNLLLKVFVANSWVPPLVNGTPKNQKKPKILKIISKLVFCWHNGYKNSKTSKFAFLLEISLFSR